MNILLVSETRLTLSYLLQFSSQWKKPRQLNEMWNSDVLLNEVVSLAASRVVPPTSAAACHKLNHLPWPLPTPELCHDLFISCLHSLPYNPHILCSHHHMIFAF